ncbi:MAG: AMP-binding protein [Rubrivivax sp.]|nr:AMP-binding protein [Rubrivivax sp.]
MRPTLVFQGQVAGPDAFEQGCLRSAAALARAGVGEGDVVALLMRNSPLAIELMIAARHLGAQWCPVNWHFKGDEVRYIIGNSGARVFIADAALLADLPGLDTGDAKVFVARGAVPGVPAWEPLRDATPPIASPAAPPRGAMFYTSGTTGRPKGIVRQPMTPAQLQANVAMRRAAYGVEPGMRALLSAPWYHSAPNSYALGLVQESGTLFLEERFDAERTLQLVDEHRLTHAYLVPTMYVRLLALPPDVRARYDLGSMRFVCSTGSPCPPDVKRRMIDWWGPVINECYGASELGYMTLLTSEQALRKPGSAGLPLPGVVLKILDDEGREQPPGTPGLIYIDQPASPDFSYVGNAGARAQMERDGLKTMGDVGYLDDEGFLFIVDRQADMVISGGVNIYPVEIEHVLQGMPGVADCAVFGIPDDEFGEALAAAVQPVPGPAGAALTAEGVRAWLHERIAGFKVPKVVTLHAQLPREETGKIFKRRLREPYWAGRERRV